MGFPPYLIGLGIPLLVGLLGIGFYIFQQERQQERQQSYSYRSYERAKRMSFCDNSDDCPICLEPMSALDFSILNCGHMLHSACLVELKKRDQNKCPKCRADIKYA